MPFNIDAARREGYSDSEINDFLAKQNNFNLEAARKEGYNDSEILTHLASVTSKKKEEKRQAPEEDGNLMRGLKNTIPSLYGTAGAAETLAGLTASKLGATETGAGLTKARKNGLCSKEYI